MADVLQRALGMIAEQRDAAAWAAASDFLEDAGHEDAVLVRAVYNAMTANSQHWRFLSPFPDESNALDLSRVWFVAFKAFLWSTAGRPCENHVRQFTRRRRPKVFHRVYSDGSLWHCNGTEDFCWKSVEEYIAGLGLVNSVVIPRGSENRDLVAWWYHRQAG